jgi:hypothetical protein
MILASFSSRRWATLLVSLTIASWTSLVQADEVRVAFDRISFMQLQGEIDRAKVDPRSEIDGSDNAGNKLPAGTILLFRTSDGNYGKLQVIEYGYNLLVRWQTYKPNGQKLKGSDRMVIKGTWTYDLDYGTEGKHPKSAADFWWEQKTMVARAWTFKGRAIFKRLEPSKEPR